MRGTPYGSSLSAPRPHHRHQMRTETHPRLACRFEVGLRQRGVDSVRHRHLDLVELSAVDERERVYLVHFWYTETARNSGKRQKIVRDETIL